MTLPTQTIDIPFSGGLDTKLDSVIVDKARLLAANNYTFNKTGTLTKRDAWQQLAGTTNIDPYEMATLNGELLIIDSATNNLYAYSEASGLLTGRGQPPYMSLSKLQVNRAAGNVLALDSASLNGYTCFAWLQLGAANAGVGVYVSIYDEASQTFIITNKQITGVSTSGPPRVCAQDSLFTVFWPEGSIIKALTLNSTTGATVTNTTTITTDYGGVTDALPLDAIPLNNGFSLLAFAVTSGRSVSAIVVSSTLTIAQSEVSIVPNSGTNLMSSIGLGAFGAGSNTIAVIAKYFAATSVTAILTWANPNLTVTHAAASTPFATPAAGGGVTLVYAGSSMWLFDSNFADASISKVQQTWVGQLSTSNVVSNDTIIGYPVYSASGLNGPDIAGKAFTLNGAAYVPVATTSALQPGLFILDSSGNVQANALYGSLASSYSDSVVGSSAKWGGVLPGSTVISTGVVSLVSAQQGQLSLTEGINTTSSGVVRLLLGYSRDGSAQVNWADSPAPLWHAQSSGCLYFSGSYLGMYDGVRCGEAGFFAFPENVVIGDSGSGSSAGTYSFVALYEWIDGQGQRHQSAPSEPVEFTLSGSGNGVVYQTSPLKLGYRSLFSASGFANCSVVFYRTTNAGETFYRINAVNNPIGNDRTAAEVGGTDTTMNVDPTQDPITANEELYTTGGYLPNDNPPACNAIAAYQGRIIYSNAEDPQDWRFSQAQTVGQGLYFNESLLGGRTPQDAGQLTAMGVLDDKLILFTPTRKLWVSGMGPASNGLNGSYSAPQLLPSDVGCVDQRTIAILPDVSVNDSPIQLARQGGMAHETRHGLYLLGRNLTDEFIGFQVDAYTEDVALTSAVLMQDKGQVRWTTKSSVVIVYDYVFGQWATFSNNDTTPLCATIWGGLWTAGDAHFIFQDTGEPGLDYGSTPVTGSFTTAWIKLSALQGFERVRRIVLFGPYGSNSTITVVENVDYDTSGGAWPSISETTSNLTTDDGLRWQFRWHIPQQKCEAVQFVITDVPDGTGDCSGAGFSGMTLELGVKKGTAKLSAGKST